jgi:spore maturation protein CgeB
VPCVPADRLPRDHLAPRMKILFIWSAAEISTFDVARGYSAALKGLGHEVYDFRLYARIKYHGLALQNDPLNPNIANNYQVVSRLASEGAVVEALRHKVDMVIGICGMGLHPDGLELLNRAGFPIAIYFTESPYDDDHHMVYAQHVGHPFANDRWSAREHGWGYIPHAYDPKIHRQRGHNKKDACDVLVIGTGWKERCELLGAVDWTGIDLRILGWWPDLPEYLRPFYTEGSVDNERAARLYASAKICINQHRFHPKAESLNPRAFELVACGALQVSDWRDEMEEVYGDTVPIYASPATLEFQLRRLLAMSPRDREGIRQSQRAKLLSGEHTFRDRAGRLMAVITSGGTNGQASRTERPSVLAGRGGAGPATVERG